MSLFFAVDFFYFVILKITGYWVNGRTNLGPSILFNEWHVTASTSQMKYSTAWLIKYKSNIITSQTASTTHMVVQLRISHMSILNDATRRPGHKSEDERRKPLRTEGKFSADSWVCLMLPNSAPLSWKAMRLKLRMQWRLLEGAMRLVCWPLIFYEVDWNTGNCSLDTNLEG